MSENSRKKSLFITGWIYFGFLIGAINTLLFSNKFFFEESEYGLTRSLIDIAILLSSFASFGAPTYVLKFFPYYKKRLANNENDILGQGLKIIVIGFIILIIITFFAKKFIYSKVYS